MRNATQFYIGGAWVDPGSPNLAAVINPATEQTCGEVALGSPHDVDRAVVAATRAFPGWRATHAETRAALLERLADIYERRAGEMAKAISTEMGAPIALASGSQVKIGLAHIRTFAKVLREHSFEHRLRPNTPHDRIISEPIGVCGLITPWNWPMNQIAQKVGAALAAGCAVVLKPSELAPLSGALFAEFIDEAGIPPGVFNLINGEGPVVGEAMALHRDIHMISLTGSGRAGAAVSRAAAATFKRVVLELGGKGPNVIFADSDIAISVARGVAQCFNNSGQSCNAPTRMLVERSVYPEAIEVASRTANAMRVGDPSVLGDHLGPLVSARQYEIVQSYIRSGIEQGANLVAGGPDRPEGMDRGYYVRPTVFADVTHAMKIGCEEIFGPVLSMMAFDDEDDAIRIANDTEYGLAGFVQTGDPARAQRMARALRCGVVVLNGAARAPGSPFGGMKQSGNGREGGRWGLEEFLETKAVSGWPAA
jgi:aldehyde dehydrogenase (NAD+)